MTPDEIFGQKFVPLGQTQTNNEETGNAAWIEEDETNIYDVIINHPQRRTLPGQRAWMQYRGIRRTIQIEEARRMAEDFQSKPVTGSDGHVYFPRLLYRERDPEDSHFRCREASYQEIITNVNTKPAKQKSDQNGKACSRSSPIKKKRKTPPPPKASPSGGGEGKKLPAFPLEGTLRSIISYYLNMLEDLEHRRGLRESKQTMEYRRTLDSIVTVPYSDRLPSELADFALFAYHRFTDTLRAMWQNISGLCATLNNDAGAPSPRDPSTFPDDDQGESGPNASDRGGSGSGAADDRQHQGRRGKRFLGDWRDGLSGVEDGHSGGTAFYGAQCEYGKFPGSVVDIADDNFSFGLPDPGFFADTGNGDETTRSVGDLDLDCVVQDKPIGPPEEGDGTGDPKRTLESKRRENTKSSDAVVPGLGLRAWLTSRCDAESEKLLPGGAKQTGDRHPDNGRLEKQMSDLSISLESKQTELEDTTDQEASSYVEHVPGWKLREDAKRRHSKTRITSNASGRAEKPKSKFKVATKTSEFRIW